MCSKRVSVYLCIAYLTTLLAALICISSTRNLHLRIPTESGMSRIKSCVIAWAISLGLTSHAKRETQLCYCVTVIKVSGNSVTKRLWDWTGNYCETGPHISWQTNISFLFFSCYLKNWGCGQFFTYETKMDVIWMACHKTGQVLNPATCWGTWPRADRCRLVSSSTSLWVFMCVCVCVCVYVCMYVLCIFVRTSTQYAAIYIRDHSAIRMWIGFNYGAFLNSCRVSLNAKGIKLSEDVAFWVMWRCTAHICVVALSYVAMYSTHLCGCSELCGYVQHTAVWLLWVMWLRTAHSCVVAVGYVAMHSTQLCGCCGLCGYAQHTAVWLLWVMWRCTAHSCVVALGYVAMCSTQLCCCSELCGCVQHTAVWLLWVMWRCTAHCCLLGVCEWDAVWLLSGVSAFPHKMVTSRRQRVAFCSLRFEIRYFLHLQGRKVGLRSQVQPLFQFLIPNHFPLTLLFHTDFGGSMPPRNYTSSHPMRPSCLFSTPRACENVSFIVMMSGGRGVWWHSVTASGI